MSWLRVFIEVAKAAVTAIKAIEAIQKLVDIVSKWAPDVAEWWNGKKIAIIGPTACGKNSLFARLRGDDIPAHHANTRGLENVGTFDFRFTLPSQGEVSIRFKGSLNVGGETDERDRYWSTACEDADIIVYMLTFEDLRQERFLPGGRVYEDLTWLAAALPGSGRDLSIHILVNKFDLALSEGESLEQMLADFQPLIDKLELAAKALFLGYGARLTGATPTSMKDPHIFAVTFGRALEAIYASAA